MKTFYFFFEKGKLKFTQNKPEYFSFSKTFHSEREAKKFADKMNTKYFKFYRKNKGGLQ